MRESLETVRYWLGDYGRAVAFVAGLIALLVAAGLYAMSLSKQPRTEELAEVIGFGASDSQMGAHPAVRVRLQGGRVVQLQTEEGWTRACRTGSRILLVRRGNVLTVHPHGCLPPPP